MREQASKSYFPALDGLRGIAVLIVLIAHAGIGPFVSGAVGVDVFLTLSGFLITSVLLAEQFQRQAISLKFFYIRRFLRLAPCLVVVTGAVALVSIVSGSREWLADTCYALTYTMNWARAFGWTNGGVLAHTWSLSLEEQFYVLWPITVILLCRFVTTRLQAVVLGSGVVAAILYRWLLIGQVSPDRIYQGIDSHADGLLLGALIALVRPRLQADASWKRTAISAACLIGILAAASQWSWTGRTMQTYGFTAIAAMTAWIICDGISPGASGVKVVLQWSPLRWLGQISYGLYLWHFPLYEALRHVDFIWGWRLAAVGIPTAILVAAASYYFIERPFLRLKDRWTAGSLPNARPTSVSHVNCLPRMPAISVIVPVFNRKTTIGRSVKSLLAQQIDQPIEIVVVDDGSIDGSPEFAVAIDSRVRVIRQANAGAAAARRRGIEAALGQYVAFLDSDDIAEPCHLQCLWDGMQLRPNVVLAYARVADIDGLPFACEHLPQVGETDGILHDPLVAALQIGCFTASMNLLVRREHALAVTCGRGHVLAANDYDFTLRMATLGPFAFVDRFTIRCDRRADGISRTKGALQAGFAVLAARDAVALSGRRDRAVQKALKERIELVWPSAAWQLFLQRRFAMCGKVTITGLRYAGWRTSAKHLWWSIGQQLRLQTSVRV